jgi:hypothetical protein
LLVKAYGTTTRPGSTRFLLPDGTRVPGDSSHDRLAGGDKALARLLAQGVVRYVPHFGVEVGKPLTDAQARIIADDFIGVYETSVSIDLVNPFTRGREVFLSKELHEPTASLLWAISRRKGPHEPLREFNPCHDPKSGKFAGRTAGRCSDTSRDDASRYAKDVRATRDERRHWAKDRRQKRKSFDHLPAFLRQDAKRAAKSDRVVVHDESHRTSWERTSSAAYATKTVTLGQDDALNWPYGKSARLSVLRHEIGHIMPETFARQARILGLNPKMLDKHAYQYRVHQLDDSDKANHDMLYAEAHDVAFHRAAQFVEEMRAWRNATKFGGGRIDWKAARVALGSYGMVAFGETNGKLHTDRAITHLKRYGRRVQKAFAVELRKAVSAGKALTPYQIKSIDDYKGPRDVRRSMLRLNKLFARRAGRVAW